MMCNICLLALFSFSLDSHCLLAHLIHFQKYFSFSLTASALLLAWLFVALINNIRTMRSAFSWSFHTTNHEHGDTDHATNECNFHNRLTFYYLSLSALSGSPCFGAMFWLLLVACESHLPFRSSLFCVLEPFLFACIQTVVHRQSWALRVAPRCLLLRYDLCLGSVEFITAHAKLTFSITERQRGFKMLVLCR